MSLLGRVDIDPEKLEKATGLYRVIDEEGRVVGEFPDIGEEVLRDLLHYMIRARVLDEWLLRLQRMGKVAIHAPNKGQEAIVGAVYPLRPEDWVFPSYRDLGVYLVRGMSEEEILDRALYNRDDPLRGSDFAIYGHRKYNMIPTPVPVGNQIPHAVGAAYAMKYRGLDTITMVMFGDGATSRGDFHAGLNFAGVFKTPTVFVCENNQWAISVPLRRQTRAPTIAFRALSYGVDAIRVDGNDVVAMYKTAIDAITQARRGEPFFIEMVTYRLGSHTTADDPTRYRSEEEVRRMERYEPLRRLRKYMEEHGYLREGEYDEIYKMYYDHVEKAAREALEKPPLPEDVFFENVYGDRVWVLELEKEEFYESLRIMKELGLEVE